MAKKNTKKASKKRFKCPFLKAIKGFFSKKKK